MAVGVENIDKSITCAWHVVMLCRVLLGVGDKEIAVDVLDAEGCKTARNIWIHKAAIGGYRRIHTIAASSGGAKDVDSSGKEVSCEEEDAVGVRAEDEALVNRAAPRVVNGEHRLVIRAQAACPSRNSSIFSVEDKYRGSVRTLI